ncbi:unnamed protein product [Cylicocyclus nassatus]|uniref:Uncharacterized protein n=1 Tax=Cylicocyclus nassatus TaxID=53992 RepID=A0AA36M265_CYLNA|nr:unnamed protein product [Cylicocyclus nassatus]
MVEKVCCRYSGDRVKRQHLIQPSKKKKESKKEKEKVVKKTATAKLDQEEFKALTPVLALTPVSEREPKTAEEYVEERKGLKQIAAQSPTAKDKKSQKDRETKVPKGLSTANSINATLLKKSDTISVASGLPRLSTASSTHAAPSKRIDTVNVAPGLPKELSKLKQPTTKKFSRKKRLKSRPMKETSIIELATKVKNRKPRIPEPDKPRSVDEIPYPRPRYDRKKKKRKTQRTKEEFVPQIDAAFLVPEADMFQQLPVAETEEIAFKPSGVTLPKTGLPMVQGNSDNNGLIMVKGQPFWFTDIPPDDTDEELVMNAAVLIDVLENRMKLVPMPDIEIVLDPMEETTALAARDSLCYTKDVIFGNTVRSMVNLNELSIHSLSLKGRKKAVEPISADELKSLAIKEPTELHEYYRATYDKCNAVPFKPTLKTRKTLPRSCGSDADSDSSRRDAKQTTRRDAQ